jgi:hypothetical protein
MRGHRPVHKPPRSPPVRQPSQHGQTATHSYTRPPPVGQPPQRSAQPGGCAQPPQTTTGRTATTAQSTARRLCTATPDHHWSDSQLRSHQTTARRIASYVQPQQPMRGHRNPRGRQSKAPTRAHPRPRQARDSGAATVGGGSGAAAEGSYQHKHRPEHRQDGHRQRADLDNGRGLDGTAPAESDNSAAGMVQPPSPGSSGCSYL